MTAPDGPPASDVQHAFREDLSHAQRATLLSWGAFTATFTAVRGITYSIKNGRGPFGNLSLGGEHLHHYMWGIGLLTCVGGVALRGEDMTRQHPATATAYGTGLALIVDEFALLLDLKDVYWAREGRISVDLAVGLIAVTGTALAAAPLARHVKSRRQRRARAAS